MSILFEYFAFKLVAHFQITLLFPPILALPKTTDRHLLLLSHSPTKAM